MIALWMTYVLIVSVALTAAASLLDRATSGSAPTAPLDLDGRPHPLGRHTGMAAGGTAGAGERLSLTDSPSSSPR